MGLERLIYDSLVTKNMSTHGTFDPADLASASVYFVPWKYYIENVNKHLTTLFLG